jgi:Xaa-Pro aminopeptidase
VLVDAGCRVAGYCSTARGRCHGRSPALERAYAACRRPSSPRSGFAPRRAARSTRSALRLEEHGYTVLHSLGHSVGLEIHEEPRLADTSTDALVAGNVVTVEPGVYLAGLGGVRIEDLVIVGEDGPEVLTPVTKELVRVS